MATGHLLSCYELGNGKVLRTRKTRGFIDLLGLVLVSGKDMAFLSSPAASSPSRSVQTPEKWADSPRSHRQPGLALEPESHPPKYNPTPEIPLSAGVPFPHAAQGVLARLPGSGPGRTHAHSGG